MFNKLRNHFISITMIFSTAILVVSFATIYYVAAISSDNRPPELDNSPEYTSDVHNIVSEHLDAERRASLNTLLVTLIIVGGLIEVVIAVASYYLAEKAIKPVKDAYETQKIFIANASHEIKTPLASIQANLEAADIHDNHFIDNVEHETVKLANLNNQLLALTRADGVRNIIKIDDFNLEKVVRENLKTIEPQLNKRQIKLNFDLKQLKVKKVKLNRTDFVQIFNILIDNAVKYCNKRIDVALTDESVSVANDGETIKPKDLEYIFERFYQADKSSEGVGLGLAIAKTLTERNGWLLTVTSDKITTFSIRFKD